MKRIYTVIQKQEENSIEITPLENGQYQLKMGDETHTFEILHQTENMHSFRVDDSQILEADTYFHQDQCELQIKNAPYQLEVFDPRRRAFSQAGTAGGGGLLVAPMPGKVIEIQVKAGDVVEAGSPIIVIEAMKMQNELNAPISGVVEEISVQEGEAVEADQKLIVMSPKE